jgi:hypothetical protein
LGGFCSPFTLNEVFTMTLSERLSEYVRACFTGLWIESHEHADALAEISLLCSQQGWRLATWDVEQGLSVHGDSGSSPVASDPLSAVQALSGLSQPDGTTILVLQNFHRFLQSAEVVQTLSRQILAGKQTRSFVVILSPVLAIPVELDKLFVTLEHALPTRDQLTEIAQAIGTEDGDLPRGAQLEVLLDAASGLTRYEAEGAFSLSLVRHGRDYAGSGLGAEVPGTAQERTPVPLPRSGDVRESGRAVRPQGVLPPLAPAVSGSHPATRGVTPWRQCELRRRAGTLWTGRRLLVVRRPGRASPGATGYGRSRLLRDEVTMV